MRFPRGNSMFCNSGIPLRKHGKTTDFNAKCKKRIDSQAFSLCFPMRFASAGFQGKTQVKLTFSKVEIRHLKTACFTGCRALFRTENKRLEARFEPSGGSGPDAPPRGRPPRHRIAPQRPSDSLFQLLFGNSYFP